MRTSKQSQVILVYAILIVVIIAVFLAMSGYIKRRLQGSYKKAADTFGLEEQFDPN
ncbi:MAG: hypothetical protein KBB01_00465 [Candidatus Omnitrophica bacterium]|jgi:uncharacterized protein YpmB|nr:hypothetical protein [Candidatus Omnitrophota bacterium]